MSYSNDAHSASELSKEAQQMVEEVKYQTTEQRIIWLWSKIHDIYREDFDIVRITEENDRTDMKAA